ncbi:MAG: GSCFA domain-containing protein [Cyanobium sp.]
MQSSIMGESPRQVRMTSSPYQQLPTQSFWKTAVVQSSPYCLEGIYSKKYKITGQMKIATAGSCFAQHISKNLAANGFSLLDLEPPPVGLPEDEHSKYGYSMYSARYGNIYTIRQLRQLAQECAGLFKPAHYAWKKGDHFIDAMRPGVEPIGFNTVDELVSARRYHLERVKTMFQEMDVFVFTLGLTEMWSDAESGTVYPLAPGTAGGKYDQKSHLFVNAGFHDILQDYYTFESSLDIIRNKRPFKVLLTVSPVPLTATAAHQHILVSTTYSKSVLRAVAGYLSQAHDHIDYFPSYELVTNPRLHSTAFTDNLRSVRNEIVSLVMSHFFAEHKPISTQSRDTEKNMTKQKSQQTRLQCEEALLEAFGK